MSVVDIAVFNIARTQVDREAVRKWLDRIGAEGYVLPSPEEISDPALLVALAAKRCYMSFEVGGNKNLTMVRKDIVRYIDNILQQGHGSVLAHSVYSFAIEGVSRVFTAEMNRHGVGWAISEGSLRFIRFDKDIPYWLPTSLQPCDADDGDLLRRKAVSRNLFERAFHQQEQVYSELIRIWDMDEGSHNFHYKKVVTSCLRRIVGMGVATGGVWTGNLRALRHVLALRTDPGAEEEIHYVFAEKIGPIMLEKETAVFGDFKRDDNGSLVPRYRKV